MPASSRWREREDADPLRSYARFSTCAWRESVSSIVTLAYSSPDDVQRWVARFDDAPAAPVSAPTAIAVSNGRVHVAGYEGRLAAVSYPPETDNYSDLLTLTYSA